MFLLAPLRDKGTARACYHRILFILKFHSNKLEFHFKLVCSYSCFNKDSKFYFKVARGSFRLLPIGGAKINSPFLHVFTFYCAHTDTHSVLKLKLSGLVIFPFSVIFTNLSYNAAFSVTNLYFLWPFNQCFNEPYILI